MIQRNTSKIVLSLALISAFVAFVPSVLLATPIIPQTGFRSTFPGEGLEGSGGWDGGGLILRWDIAFDSAANLWNYAYSFIDDDTPTLEPALTGWIFEVSLSITPNNIDQMILNPNFSFSDQSPTTWSNPGLIYGVFITTGTSDVFDTYTFSSPQAPMWGDFSAFGSGGEVANNLGFGGDPSSTATDFLNWIPVPDTENGQAPEPGTLLLLGAGLFALYRRRG